MATVKKSYKKTSKKSSKSKKNVKSAIIAVRISDCEKERIDEIMMNMDIKRYSDVMRMALHMINPPMEYTQMSLQ